MEFDDLEERPVFSERCGGRKRTKLCVPVQMPRDPAADCFPDQCELAEPKPVSEAQEKENRLAAMFGRRPRVIGL